MGFMSSFFKKILFLLLIGFVLSVNSQQNNIKLNGLVVDANNEPIPYAAVGILSKSIGTSTTEEGRFFLLIPSSLKNNFIKVSSLGFKTYKIKVEDFLNQPEKKIILTETVMSLDEIVISIKPSDYVNKALKSLKKNTLSRKHQLKILYRRFSGEDGKARFFVEHFMNVLDRGPSATDLGKIAVIEGRRSADYRFVKMKQHSHSINYMSGNNPLRNGFNIKDYKWKKIGDTSYNDEDVLIIEGSTNKGKYRKIKLYIDLESFKIYRFETSSPWLKTLYVYKENKNGKLHLNYHNRKMTRKEPLTKMQKMRLNTKAEKIQVSYSHEVYVLGVETNKDKMNFKSFGGWGIDIGDVDITYNPVFWNNFSIPPATKFYKKNIKELESIFGVPLEVQFKTVNK